MLDCTYTINRARYAKGQVAIACPSPDDLKTRAARIVSAHLSGRYSKRERAYIVSPAKAAKFVRLFDAGMDACVMTGKLYDPNAECADA